MRNDQYLGELAAELRLRLPEDVSADLVGEVAAHLDASRGDPVAEFGEPHQLAAEMVSTYGGSNQRILVQLGVGTISIFCLLIALPLLASGMLEASEIGFAAAQAVVLGAIVQFARAKVRAGFRNGNSKPILVAIAGLVAVVGVTGLILSRTDFVLDPPASRLIGVGLLVLSAVAGWFVYRPLRFNETTGLKTNLLTGNVKPR